MTVLLVLAAAGLLLAVFASTRPETFRIERSALIQARGVDVLAHVEDLRRWEGWSPWWKLEPTQQVRFSGAAAGVGAVYEWNGKKTGQGRIEIQELRPGEYLKLRLQFFKPFPGDNVAEFRLVPEGTGGVRVTWSMTGKNGFMGKLFSLVVSMDRMVGKDFEKGLADLKRLAEGTAAAEPQRASA